MAKSRVTLRDIANAVGVHPSTVSRVLNSKTRQMVTDDIAGKILSTADEMGYRPNLFALSLKTNRSYTAGVLIPDLNNPVFPPIITGIDQVMDAAGYTVIVANTDNRAERERTSLERLRERHVDGVILATAQRNDDLVKHCREENIPVVLINRSTEEAQVPYVIADDFGGISQVVDHLAGLGHRKIAHVAGPQTMSTGARRYQGFIAGLRKNNLELHDDLVVSCDAFTEAEGRRAASKLIATGTDFSAVVAGNDLLALGCYDAFHAKGIRCGRDVSVTGYNDMPFADKFNPPLTTVHVPLQEMGAEAARMLLERLNDPETPARSIHLKAELIVRKSTGPVRTKI